MLINKTKNRPKIKESQIQNQIIQYLDLLDSQGLLYFFRSASGAVPTQSGRFFKSGRAGCPDISIVTKSGHYIGVEVKTPLGRMSPAQKITQVKLENLGGTYIVARSVEELKNDLRILEVI